MVWTTEIFPRSWRLGIWNQDVGKVVVFQGLSPWLVDGRLVLGSSHHLPSVLVCVLLSSFYRTPLILNKAPLWWPHFNLITSLKASSSNTHPKALRDSTSAYLWGMEGDSDKPNSAHNRRFSKKNIFSEYINLLKHIIYQQ